MFKKMQVSETVSQEDGEKREQGARIAKKETERKEEPKLLRLQGRRGSNVMRPTSSMDILFILFIHVANSLQEGKQCHETHVLHGHPVHFIYSFS